MVAVAGNLQDLRVLYVQVTTTTTTPGIIPTTTAIVTRALRVGVHHRYLPRQRMTTGRPESRRVIKGINDIRPLLLHLLPQLPVHVNKTHIIIIPTTTTTNMDMDMDINLIPVAVVADLFQVSVQEAVAFSITGTQTITIPGLRIHNITDLTITIALVRRHIINKRQFVSSFFFFHSLSCSEDHLSSLN
jgi:hypothetical protein